MEILTDKYKIKIRSLEELGYKPRYKVDRKDETNKHTYTIDGWETSYVGVSSVLSILNKPYLCPWAAKECSLKAARLLKKLAAKYEKILFKPGVPEFDQQNIKKLYDRLTMAKKIDALTFASKNAHTRLKDTAADIGSRSHLAIDNIINGISPTIDSQTELPVSGFLDWIKKTKLTVAAGDTKVASLEYGFGGSLDLLMVDEQDRPVLGDFKTSKAFSDTFPPQCGAYSQAAFETYGLPTLPPAFIIRLDKLKPIVEIRGIAFVNESWKFFESLLNAYRLAQINYYNDCERWSYAPNKIAGKSSRKKENENHGNPV